MKAFLQAIGRVMYRLVMPLRRRRLKNRSVSIVSNDCWSSFMYRFYGLPFNSPFVGLFIMPDHYLAMLENPEVLATPPRMTSSAESVYADRLSDLPPYPLGILPGGIEIHFLHYATAEEALDKWTRRMSRLDWDNCIVKFSRNNGCTDGHLRRFDALPFRSSRETISWDAIGNSPTCTMISGGMPMPSGSRSVDRVDVQLLTMRKHPPL